MVSRFFGRNAEEARAPRTSVKPTTDFVSVSFRSQP
jgi:hypothetical protein